MKKITYVIGGDLREPLGSDQKKVIAHCVNDQGRMGAGVAKALFEKWPSVRSEYIKWFQDDNGFSLGNSQIVKVENDICVVNIIGQHDTKIKDGIPPVRYEAIQSGFRFLNDLCDLCGTTIHLPYLMGCDLAGGKWEEVEALINKELVRKGKKVYVYDLFRKRVPKEGDIVDDLPW